MEEEDVAAVEVEAVVAMGVEDTLAAAEAAQVWAICAESDLTKARCIRRQFSQAATP